MSRIPQRARAARPIRAAAAGAFAALAALAFAPAAQAQNVDPNLARNLAATCANCHGTAGAARGSMASLAGVPAERTLELLLAYRNGQKPATVMHQITKGYTEEQLRLVAQWFAAQPAPATVGSAR